MKQKHLSLAGVLCYVMFFNAHAQLLPPVHQKMPQKSMLFSHLPEQFAISNLWMDKLFAGPDSGQVRISVNAGNFLEGVIMEKVQVNPNVVSINVKLSNYDGALLSLSKITYDDATIKYNGSITSLHYADLFLLAQENNALYFKKKKQSVVIAE